MQLSCTNRTSAWYLCNIGLFMVNIEFMWGDLEMGERRALLGSYWTKGSSWLNWSHYFESFTIATMTWLTAMEYLCQKWPWICSTCRKHFPVLSSFMTYHQVCNYINTTGATGVAWTEYPSGAPEFTPVFSGVRVARSLAFCVRLVDRCLSFCTFSFGHCIVCSSSIYGSNSSYIIPFAVLSSIQQMFCRKDAKETVNRHCV
jgi:hypothetical protein